MSAAAADLDAVLRALADRNRRGILALVRERPRAVGEIAEQVPMTQQAVSHHLRVLREAGLVDVRQEAQRRIYSLRPEPLSEVDAWLGNYRVLWQNRLDALRTEIARGRKTRP